MISSCGDVVMKDGAVSLRPLETFACPLSGPVSHGGSQAGVGSPCFRAATPADRIFREIRQQLRQMERGASLPGLSRFLQELRWRGIGWFLSAPLPVQTPFSCAALRLLSLHSSFRAPLLRLLYHSLAPRCGCYTHPSARRIAVAALSSFGHGRNHKHRRPSGNSKKSDTRHTTPRPNLFRHRPPGI